MAEINSTATLDALLKDKYQPDIISWVNLVRPLYTRITKVTDPRRFEGRRFLFAVENANPQGIRATSEGDAMPVSGSLSIENMSATVATYNMTVRMTRQMIDQSRTDMGAFARAMDKTIESSRNELELSMAWDYIFGEGSGRLGRVLSYSGTSLIFRDQPTYVGEMGTRRIKRAMQVDSYSALTGGVQGAANVLLGTVTNSTATATVPGSSGFNAGDYVFRAGARGKSPMGLGGIVDDGSRLATIQGLTRATEPLANANILGNSGTLRAWTPTLQDQCATEAWNNGNGTWPTAFYSALGAQLRAVDIIRNDRRADMKEMNLDNGFKALSWTTPDGVKPWIVDQMCRSNTIMAINENDLVRAVMNEIQINDRDGRTQRFVDRTDSLESWWFTDQTLVAETFTSHTALNDISYTL